MSTQYDKLVDMIEQQQKGHDTKPRFTIGEQLKDMAKGDARIIDLLLTDLDKEELSLEAAEKMLAAYAAKHRGNAKEFCITPTVADRLLREMYGLPQAAAKSEASGLLDLDSFL